jgi:hypothetical protein
MSALDRLRKRLHRRKRNRERKRRLHQGRRALREARAVQHLRALIDRFRSKPQVMFDDTSVDLIPRSARAVAGYANGLYKTVPALRRRFPKAQVVTIAVTSDVLADALDVEPGDATNADAPGWFRHFKAHRPHRRPIFYTSASNVAALVEVLHGAGIERHAYLIWSAHYNGHRHVCAHHVCGYPKAEATQWTDRSNNRSLDESKLTLAFWDR